MAITGKGISGIVLFKQNLSKDFKITDQSQTSFGYISINSSMILTVSMAMESPQKDLSINASYVLRQSILAKILGRSTSNYHGTVY